MFTHLR